MADYDIKLNTNQLVEVLSKNDAIKGLLESVLNQVLASQMTEQQVVFSVTRCYT